MTVMKSGETGTLRMLAALWEKSKPTVMERVTLLERTAEALGAGKLDDTLRKDAVSAAHKLAGTLGMFGYPEGTELARSIEQMLEADTMPADAAAKMQGWCAELRKALDKH